MKKILLSIENGSLSEGTVPVLSSLDLRIREGSVTGIYLGSLREKSALMDWLGGNVTMNGRIFWEDREITGPQIRGVLKKAAAVVQSGSMLIPTLSSEENVLLFAEKAPFISGKSYHRRYLELLEHFEIPHNHRVFSENSICGHMILQLLKAYAEGKQLVVISDSAGLIAEDYTLLSRILCRMTEEGMSFLLADTSADPLFDNASSLYILRHGKTLALYDDMFRDGRTNRSIIESFTFSRIGERQLSAAAGNAPGLEFDHVSTPLLRDLQVSVPAGSVLRLVCLDQKSRQGMLRLLNGEDPSAAGSIRLNGAPVSLGSPQDRLRNRICLIEESPHSSMLLQNMDLFDNLALPLSRKSSALWINRDYRKNILRFASSILQKDLSGTRIADLTPADRLRIVYLRWILFGARAVICINPFSDVDASLLRATMEMLREMQQRGIAVLILSETAAAGDVLSCEQYYLRDGSLAEGAS